MRAPDGSVPAQPPHDEAQRIEALRSYEILDTLPEAAFEDLVFLTAYICRTPIALVSLVDDKRQWFKAKVGLDASETPRTQAFCAHALLTPHEPFVVPDASEDPRFATNPLVTSGPSIRFYAGVPLVSPDGFALGTLCAIDRQPRELEPEQRRALGALAREVTVQLELRRDVIVLSRELEGARASRSSSAATADAAHRADEAARKTESLRSRPDATHVEDRLRSVLDRLQTLQRRGVPSR